MQARQTNVMYCLWGFCSGNGTCTGSMHVATPPPPHTTPYQKLELCEPCDSQNIAFWKLVPIFRIVFPPPTPKSVDFPFWTWVRKKSPYKGNLILLSKGMEVLETAVGAVFCPDQVLLSKNFHPRPGCRQKSLLRKSGVGGGGQILILKFGICNTTYRSSQNYYRQSCYSWKFISRKLPLPLPSWTSDELPLPLLSWPPQSALHFH